MTENEKLYTFTLNQVSLCDLISDSNSPLTANKIIWNKDGRCFIVCDKKQMMIGTKLDAENENDDYDDGNLNNNEKNENLENFNNMFNQINQNFQNDNNHNNDEEEEPQTVPIQYKK